MTDIPPLDWSRVIDPGIHCPKCGSRDSRVHYTRPRSGGILRVRVCRGCRHRFPTFETGHPAGKGTTHANRAS